MKNFRDTYFAKFFCYLMVLSFVLVSCDPEGDLINNHRIDKEIDKKIESMENSFTPQECDQARLLLQEAKALAMTKSRIGRFDRSALLDQLLGQAIQRGELSMSNAERTELVQRMEADAFHLGTPEESLDGFYDWLALDGRINGVENAYLKGFEDRLENLTSQSEVEASFNAIRAELSSDNTLSGPFKQALSAGMEQAELMMCATEGDGLDQIQGPVVSQERCSIEVCVKEYKWVIAIITIVIAVVAIILAIFTFGLSLKFISITAAVWKLVVTVVCETLPCPIGPEDCPPGQVLTCLPGFILNGDNLCEGTGFALMGRALFGSKDSNGNCPPGSYDTSASPPIECAFGSIDNVSGGIFSGLVDGESFWVNGSRAFHIPVCN